MRRDEALQALGYGSYDDYLASAAWRAVRDRYREERPWLCNVCGEAESLHLHHRTYERVGQEDLDDLMPLCRGCHELVHTLEARGLAGLDFEAVIDRERALKGRALLADMDERRRHEDSEQAQAVLAEHERKALAVRIRAAKEAARYTGAELRDPLRRLAHMIRTGYSRDKIERQMRRVERDAFNLPGRTRL